MNQLKPVHAQLGALLALALAAPTVALAYGERDAIRDCESRLRSKYQISDLRDATAERLQDRLHHYKVQGLAKVDGEKYPWTCEIVNRRVADIQYQGRDSGRGRYEGGGAPPQLIAGSNGEAEVVFKNDCVVYYDRRGRRTNVAPKCQGNQVTKADQALRAYRREQGL